MKTRTSTRLSELDIEMIRAGHAPQAPRAGKYHHRSLIGRLFQPSATR